MIWAEPQAWSTRMLPTMSGTFWPPGVACAPIKAALRSVTGLLAMGCTSSIEIVGRQAVAELPGIGGKVAGRGARRAVEADQDKTVSGAVIEAEERVRRGRR